MKEFFDKLLDLFFPPRCPFCRGILKDGEKLLCGKCGRDLPRTQGEERTQRFRHLDACLSPLYYEDHVRRSLLRFKFGGMSVYAPKYAELMEPCLREADGAYDVITWAPLGRKRLRKRGYDQARLLAEALAVRLGKPCERLLVKCADNPPQSGAGSPEKRRKNVSGVYRACDPARIKGRRILLVDDIVTTGATLSECARVLKAAGARSVLAVTLARSRKD